MATQTRVHGGELYGSHDTAALIGQSGGGNLAVAPLKPRVNGYAALHITPCGEPDAIFEAVSPIRDDF